MAAEISFTLSEQDCVDAARDQYRHRLSSPRRWGWPAAFLGVTLGLLVYSDSCGPESALYTGAAYAALVVVVCPLLAVAGYLLVGKQARRMFRQQVIHPQSRMSWSDEGFQSRNEFGSFAAGWRDFYGWREVRGSYTLYINEGFYYLIPRHALSREQAADLERTLVESGLAKR